ncbi:hypothetical protein V5O48_007175 [Marasmius crinis-equi]|uniref:Mitochondrial carrier n=1 Tax=Marasmius crinis-equi TaxID=585013 RepID=A0ABR3FHZ2_9AGAR
MRWIYPLLLHAASRVLALPFSGSIIRYRASYNPRHDAALTAESGLILERVGPVLDGFWHTLYRSYRLEGWAGLYKGSMPVILETLIIRGSLAFVKIHPAVPLVLIAAPQLAIPEAILFVFFYTLVELPMIVLTIRAITTPYKLCWSSPFQALDTLLSPAERLRPYILYKTPGLFVATALRTAFPLFFLHFVFDLATRSFTQEVGLAVFSAAIVLYVMAFLASTVLLTPLDVIVVRLALQRNRANSLELEPLEGEDDEGFGSESGVGSGRKRYSDTEDVLSLRNEYNRNRYMGFMDCFRTILAEEGWSALFRAWWYPLVAQVTTVMFYRALR